MTKFSWQILNTYVDIQNLDKAELADEIALKVLEVDEVTDDYIDIDVTPNRAHDCLAHIGIAREIATVKNLEYNDLKLEDLDLPEITKVTDGKFNEEVRRFVTVEITDVEFNESPQWLQDRLAEVGQKSINTIVDLTNYVMFEVGQPLHAYDLDKLPSSELGVRFAGKGESLELLDGKTHELYEANLVITDSNDLALGLAGVKGGALTQISDSTTNILLESANFHPTVVRKSGTALGLRTDALKRFENEPSSALSEIAALRFCQLLKLEQPNAEIKAIYDYYPNNDQASPTVTLEHALLEARLGTTIDTESIVEICKKQSISVDQDSDNYQLTAPYWRLDLNIFADYVEEFGRLIGYDTIIDKTLPKLERVASEFDLYTTIRNTLVDLGLFEVQTYTLVKKGDLETLKPLASDKGALRKTIAKQLIESLTTNNRNAELFGVSTVGLFEIGSVFPKTGETKHLAIALAAKPKATNKQFEVISEKLEDISPELVKDWKVAQVEGGAVVEIDISGVSVEKVVELPTSSSARFLDFSNQPFVMRDISVWVGADGSRDDLEKLIQENSGENLLAFRLVDEFQKDERLSLAYRLVFQNSEKTLTDAEVQVAMDKVYKVLESNYELR